VGRAPGERLRYIEADGAFSRRCDIAQPSSPCDLREPARYCSAEGECSPVVRSRELLHAAFARSRFLDLLLCCPQVIAGRNNREQKNEGAGDGQQERREL